MNFESFEAIMDYAVKREEEAVAFYTELASIEKYAVMKDAFLEFAEEEGRHVTFMQNFSKNNLEHYRARKVPDLKRSDYAVDMEYQPGMEYEDVLRLAAQKEDKAIKLYNDFSQRCENSDHKKLFETLAQEEAKHKLKFETMLDDHFAVMGD